MTPHLRAGCFALLFGAICLAAFAQTPKKTDPPPAPPAPARPEPARPEPEHKAVSQASRPASEVEHRGEPARTAEESERPATGTSRRNAQPDANAPPEDSGEPGATETAPAPTHSSHAVSSFSRSTAGGARASALASPVAAAMANRLAPPAAYSPFAGADMLSPAMRARRELERANGENRVYAIPDGSLLRTGATATVSDEAPVSATRSSGRLTPEGAARVLEQVNSARSNMSGINHLQIPPGKVTVLPDGRLTVVIKPGHSVGIRPDGTLASIIVVSPADPFVRSGAEGAASGRGPITPGMAVPIAEPLRRINFNADGKISEIHNRNNTIYRGPHGIRTVIDRRADKSILVTTGRHSGYLEDSFTSGSVTYTRRTVVAGQRVMTRAYRSVAVNRVHVERYVAPRYYSPEFYTWLESQSVKRFPYRWGKPVIPNNGYYIFAPSYTSVHLWLTDYVFDQVFQDAALAQTPATADDAQTLDPNSVAAGDDTPVTPDVTDAIAAQAQQRIDDEAAAANADDPSAANASHMLTPNRYFVVGNPLQVLAADGRLCTLDSGNVLRLLDPPADNTSDADLVVASSRRSDCPADTQVTLPLTQLQEMENTFNALLDDGIRTLYSSDGQSGLPVAPDAAKAAPRPAYVSPNVQESVTQSLQTQWIQANQAEAEARQYGQTELTAPQQAPQQ